MHRQKFHPFARTANAAPANSQVAIGTPGWVPYGVMVQPGYGSTIFDVLVRDHNRARNLIAQVRAGNVSVYPQLADSLRRHSYAEEQTLYRALENVPTLRAREQQNWREHEALASMLRQLDGLPLGNGAWRSLFGRMTQALENHIAVEEGTPGVPGSLFAAAAVVLPMAQQVELGRRYDQLYSQPVATNPAAPQCWTAPDGRQCCYTNGQVTCTPPQSIPAIALPVYQQAMVSFPPRQRNPSKENPKPSWWHHFSGLVGLHMAPPSGWYRAVSPLTPSTGGKKPYVLMSSPTTGVLYRRLMPSQRVRIVNRRQRGHLVEVEVAPLVPASVRKRRNNPDYGAQPRSLRKTYIVCEEGAPDCYEWICLPIIGPDESYWTCGKGNPVPPPTPLSRQLGLAASRRRRRRHPPSLRGNPVDECVAGPDFQMSCRLCLPMPTPTDAGAEACAYWSRGQLSTWFKASDGTTRPLDPQSPQARQLIAEFNRRRRARPSSRSALRR